LVACVTVKQDVRKRCGLLSPQNYQTSWGLQIIFNGKSLFFCQKSPKMIGMPPVFFELVSEIKKGKINHLPFLLPEVLEFSNFFVN
jgi:hypothetical protein